MAMRGYRLIVLAAQRRGETDPLAACFNTSHKCLVPMNGRPLISRVVQTGAAYPAIRDVVISVEPDAFGPVLRATASPLRCSAPVRCVAAARNIADSVRAAADGHDGPLIVTTADNALLLPTSLDAMVKALQEHDAAFAMASKQAVLAAHPQGQRRFYRFRDGEYSNCNLYGIASPAALKAAEVFRGGGQFARRAGRIVSAFGLLNLLLLRLRAVSLDEAAARISARLGLSIAPVILADGSQAIDVDNERTYSVVSKLLEKRQNDAAAGRSARPAPGPPAAGPGPALPAEARPAA